MPSKIWKCLSNNFNLLFICFIICHNFLFQVFILKKRPSRYIVNTTNDYSVLCKERTAITSLNAFISWFSFLINVFVFVLRERKHFYHINFLLPNLNLNAIYEYQIEMIIFIQSSSFINILINNKLKLNWSPVHIKNEKNLLKAKHKMPGSSADWTSKKSQSGIFTWISLSKWLLWTGPEIEETFLTFVLLIDFKSLNFHELSGMRTEQQRGKTVSRENIASFRVEHENILHSSSAFRK